ncbi:hypothetical protein GCM10007897_32100 [Sphingobium jiangsuense]|uniref:DUF6950 domain-containing protein n=1 Tax=Sphingobium jiangsuense TaxID=870476 RepID=A0A7W6BND4_9SPHN|nr:hypothetical protein [Sphingobium jiangsuense]MBB3928322.1 hypothetical protein [Sphingobium jiangsuense]GLT01812.1 hypothetical protein GCM10007897_32100 [Sphingobium jiangsuense]
MTPIEKRHQATTLTVEKYKVRAFRWGSCDCGKIAAFHARKFGWKVPKTGTYKSAIGAAKYLKSLGVETLPELLDQIGFAQIAPAAAMMGDFVSFASDDPIGGVGIVVGNGNMMAFHEAHATPVIMSMANIDRAWSILPVEIAHG